MAYNYEYPYTDNARFNDDWILTQMKELIANWASVQTEWSDMETEFAALKQYVIDSIENLDFQEEVNIKLDAMAEDGTLAEMINTVVMEQKVDISDLFFNGVQKGIEIANGGGLLLSVSSGVAYLNGKRVVTSATVLTLPVNADNYIHLSNDGVISKISVNNGVVDPGIPDNNIRIGFAITNATIITTFFRYTRNTVFGDMAMVNNKTGYDNVVVGFQAMENNTSGHRNIAVGIATMESNTTGHHNIAVGQNALLLNTEGVYNTALGIDGLRGNTIGGYNIAVGQYSMLVNSTGNSNVAVGISALSKSVSGDGNLALGAYALENQNGLSKNIGIGSESLRMNTGGLYLTSVGITASKNNTTGNRNNSFGYEALFAETTGSDNVAYGAYSVRNNIVGNSNVGVGNYSLYTGTGNNNTGIGHQSLYKATTVDNNVGIGSQAGYQITTGANNTFVGATAGGTTYQNATVSNTTAIGYGAVTSEDNTVQLGNTSVTKVLTTKDFESSTAGYGFVCKSPDGTRYRIKVANGGTISVVSA